MQNRRDQVQAHMFVMGRLTSGLLRVDLDSPESPVGRTNRGLVTGIVIAVLVAAGAFVFGLISPGTSDSWRASGTLIVDKQTGARYLYVDGTLRPVLNYASALLLVGAADLSTKTAGHGSLSGAQRGAPVGIDGAPDALPDAGDLGDDTPWLVCSTLSADTSGAGTGTAAGAGAASAAPAASTVLSVGTATGGQPLRSGSALLVSGPDGTRYLVWKGSRLRLDSGAGALETLGYGPVSPRPVTAEFLDALPAGPDLTAPDVPGRGTAGPVLGGLTTRVGQVFRTQVPGADSQYYLLRQEGLVPLTATEAALELGDPDTGAKAYGGSTPTARQLEAGALSGHLVGKAASGTSAELPAVPPTAVTVASGSEACAGVSPDAGSGIQVGVTFVAADALNAVAAQGTVQPGGPAQAVAAACLPVDQVSVPPGGGALVKAASADGSAVGDTTYLVTDTGVKYAVPTSADVQALGYTEADTVRVPTLLLSMLPTGPVLDQAAASTGGGTGFGTGPGAIAGGGTGGGAGCTPARTAGSGSVDSGNGSPGSVPGAAVRSGSGG
jgi:type VII secretion protein EccB